MGSASNKKKAAKILRNVDRLHYPEDEATYPWLSALLNAYHIQETGVAVELEQEMKQRAKKLACGKGCDVCCLRPTVPLTEPEIRGVAWYAAKQLSPGLREKVKNQVLNRHKSLRCPFLVEGACSVYPVRPIACRILHVFGEPCSPAGDIYLTRARDMWAHSRDLGRRVSYALMPLYGITGRLNMERAFDEGFLTNNSTSMMDQPWETLWGFEG